MDSKTHKSVSPHYQQLVTFRIFNLMESGWSWFQSGLWGSALRPYEQQLYVNTLHWLGTI